MAEKHVVRPIAHAIIAAACVYSRLIDSLHASSLQRHNATHNVTAALAGGLAPPCVLMVWDKTLGA